jgi:hypothetical protein
LEATNDWYEFMPTSWTIYFIAYIGYRDLISIESYERTWNFFIGLFITDSWYLRKDYALTRKCSGKPKLTTDYFPNDLDTTSIALTTLRMKDEVAASVLDEMLQYVNEDGLVLVG